MRILIIHNFYQDPGGEDVVFQQEVAALKEIYEVETLTFKNEKGLKGLLQFFLSPFNLPAASLVDAKIASFKPNIIHLHNTQYACGPAIIRKISQRGVPLVMTVHNFRLLCPSASLFFNDHLFLDSIKATFPWKAIRLGVLDHSRLKTAWLAFSYGLHRKIDTWNKVDRYVVLSEFAKNLFAQASFPVSTDKFSIKPNFVEAIPKAENTFVTPKKRFLYLGRIAAEKGVMPLVKALKNSTFELAIAGNGPQLEALKEAIQGHDNISYLGSLTKEQIAQQLQVSTALIVPSICLEGMPLTVLEAFSAGTPVLASNLGVLKEMITPGYTGDLFDPNDPASILQCMERWQQISTEKWLEIAAHCQATYQEKYSKKSAIDTLIQLYKSTILSKKEFVSLHK